MINSTNILVYPFVLAATFIDAFLFLIVARMLVGRLANRGQVYLNLCQLTDGVVKAAEGWLARSKRPSPKWLPWVVVITAGVVVRHFLIWIIESM